MKKITLILSFIFIAIISLTVEMKAQNCPPGFTSKTEVLTINNCQWIVEFCYICNSVGGGPLQLQIKKIRAVQQSCNGTISFEMLYYAALEQIANYDYINTYLCPNIGTPPPCDPPPTDESKMLKIPHWLCWKITVVDDNGQRVWNFVPCNYNNYCEEIYYFCRDLDHPNGYKRISYSHQLIGSPSNCPTEFEHLNFYPAYPGQESECFIHHTICY